MLITFSILLVCKVLAEFQNFEIMMIILTIIIMVTETLRVDTMPGFLHRIF